MPARLSSSSSGRRSRSIICSRASRSAATCSASSAVLLGLQEPEREVLQLGLHPGHAEAVRQRGVDLPGLGGDAGALLRLEVLEGPHVVQAVGQLDDDDPRVLGDREQELPVVLDLLLGGGPEGQVGDLGEPVHDGADLGAEVARDVLDADVGVLDHVVQQGRRDRGRVGQLLRQDHRHGNAVGDEVLARRPLLPPVRRRADAQGPLDQVQIEPVRVPREHRAEIGRQVERRSGHRSPAVAKLVNRSPAITT